MKEIAPRHFSSEDLLKRIQGQKVEPSINQIKRILSGMHPSEVAHSIESLPPKERKFLWSLVDTHDEGEIIAEFGPSQRGVHNDGVNIAAKEGIAVGAAAGGRVAFVGANIKSFGRLVLIKHDGGIITAYAHLGEVAVKEGEVVALGQAIGSIGQSGRVDFPQLHFEIRKSRQPIDPRSLIS